MSYVVCILRLYVEMKNASGVPYSLLVPEVIANFLWAFVKLDMEGIVGT